MKRGDKVWVTRSNGKRTIAEVSVIPPLPGGRVYVTWMAWFKAPVYGGGVDLDTECEIPPGEGYVQETLGKWADAHMLAPFGN